MVLDQCSVVVMVREGSSSFAPMKSVMMGGIEQGIFGATHKRDTKSRVR